MSGSRDEDDIELQNLGGSSSSDLVEGAGAGPARRSTNLDDDSDDDLSITSDGDTDSDDISESGDAPNPDDYKPSRLRQAGDMFVTAASGVSSAASSAARMAGHAAQQARKAMSSNKPQKTRHILPDSPDFVNAALSQYSKSFDLSRFEKFADGTAQKVEAVSTFDSVTAEDGTTHLDLTTLGGVGASIKQHLTTNPDNALRHKQLADSLGELGPKTKLTEPGGIRDKYKALSKQIKGDSDGFHTPAQLVPAFAELKAKLLQELKDRETAAVQHVKELLIPTEDADHLTAEQTNLATLCDINTTTEMPEIRKKLTEKAEQLAEQVSKKYKASAKELNEYFNGSLARKEGDTEIPATKGLDKELQQERERSEADLITRINQLEQMESRGFKASDLRTKQDDKLTGSIGEEQTDPESRQNLLKGQTLSDLRQKDWEGRLFGRSQLKEVKSRRGHTISIEEGNEENGVPFKASMVIPAKWFSTDAAWAQRLELDFEDMVDQVKAKKKDTPSIEFTIDHKIDECRHAAILAAYKAARKKGYKPEEIKMTITGGSDEKQNFTSKPALEVLKATGQAGADAQIQADLQKFEKQKANIDKKAQAGIKERVEELKLESTSDSNQSDEDRSHSLGR